MATGSIMRRADAAHLRGSGERHDASAFLGDWRCTDSATPSLSRAVLVQRDETLFIRDPQSGGLLAIYDHDFGQVTIAGNSKRGTLVLATYMTFTDGSGRRDYYQREFFHRALEAHGDGSEISVDNRSGPSLFGVWRNTAVDSEGIVECRVADSASGTQLRLSAASSGFLAGIEVEATARICGGVAFVADCRVGDAEVRLAANLNRGLLIIASFFCSTMARADFVASSIIATGVRPGDVTRAWRA